MKKLQKEITAVVLGIGMAYVWQLFFLLMCYMSNPNCVEAEMFIPVSAIQFAIAPIVAWGLMGVFKVSWLATWVRVTMCISAFLIPFTIISVGTVMCAPTLWRKTGYWVISIVISLILAFSVFKSRIQFNCSNVEKEKPEENE